MAKSKNHNEQTLALIAEVKKRKAEIVAAERPHWRTNCVFSFVEGSSQTVNLQVMSDIGQLIKIASFVETAYEGYEKTVAGLSLEAAPEFEWRGFSAYDWITDIKTRLAKIQIAAKRTKLEALESRLNAVISPELKAKMELDAISEELGK